jgi:predicted dehydrogenase
MSPARPTRWGVAGCRARLLEPLGVALRDSELATSVAVLADPSAWDDAAHPERLARLLRTDVVAAAGFPSAGAEASYLSAAAADGSEGMQLLRALARAGCALLLQPPLPPAAEELAAPGSSPVLLAAAHLWRWHPVAVTASDLVEAHGIGEVLSAGIQTGIQTGIQSGPSSGPASRAGLLDVLGLVLAGDDVAALQPAGPGPGRPAAPGTTEWQGRTRGGVPVRVALSAPDVPPDGCTITVTGSRGQINAAMQAPGGPGGAGGDAAAGQGRLQLVADGQDETVPVLPTDPVRVLVDRFSRAALGASPWGWSFARDLRLQALARDAAGQSAGWPSGGR